jgi:transcriptional regulator GlxA family with amidase domain
MTAVDTSKLDSKYRQ